MVPPRTGKIKMTKVQLLTLALQITLLVMFIINMIHHW